MADSSNTSPYNPLNYVPKVLKWKGKANTKSTEIKPRTSTENQSRPSTEEGREGSSKDAHAQPEMQQVTEQKKHHLNPLHATLNERPRSADSASGRTWQQYLTFSGGKKDDDAASLTASTTAMHDGDESGIKDADSK